MQNKDDSEFSKSLLTAFQQNYEHARHVEIQRQQQLYIFVVLFAAVLTFIFSSFGSIHIALQQYWPVFLFLTLYSFIISSSISKWNIEFKSHLRHIQWISEKLHLIQPISERRRQAVYRTQIPDDKETLLKDAMSQSYVALALPLKIQVNRDFEYIINIIFGGTTFAFVSGFVIYIDSLFPILPSRTAAYIIGLILSVLIVLWNIFNKKRIKAYAQKLLDVREPEGIKLHYQGRKPFYWEYENIDEEAAMKTSNEKNAEVKLLKLSDPDNINRWVVGTPPAVEKDSPFYSGNIQINHIKNPPKENFFKNEKSHSHKFPIEELYLVLEGTLEVEIGSNTVSLKPKEILLVPSEKVHKINDFSDNIEFLVIRSPISNDETKTVSK